jgi:hypothetical protein
MNDLKHFLRISTGSDIILVERISISFTSSVGKSRTPVFHMCGAVILITISAISGKSGVVLCPTQILICH